MSLLGQWGSQIKLDCDRSLIFKQERQRINRWDKTSLSSWQPFWICSPLIQGLWRCSALISSLFDSGSSGLHLSLNRGRFVRFLCETPFWIFMCALNPVIDIHVDAERHVKRYGKEIRLARYVTFCQLSQKRLIVLLGILLNRKNVSLSQLLLSLPPPASQRFFESYPLIPPGANVERPTVFMKCHNNPASVQTRTVQTRV